MWSAPRLVLGAAAEAARAGVGVAEAGVAAVGARSRRRRGRRVWVSLPRVWVEVPDLGSERYGALLATLTRALGSRREVVSVQANQPVQRLCVTLVPSGNEAPVGERLFAEVDDSPAVAALLELIESVENQWWASHPPTRSPPLPVSLPGDPDSLAFRAAAVGADLVGLGMSVAGGALHLPRLPLLAPALTTFADTQPRLRGLLEQRWGKDKADALLAASNAMLQGLAGTTPALVVDLAARSISAGEAQANRVA